MPTHVLKTQCPYCGAPNNGHTETNHEGMPPHPGAVALCAYCKRLGIFDNSPLGLIIRKPSSEELSEILADPDIQKVIQIIEGSSSVREAIARFEERGLE